MSNVELTDVKTLRERARQHVEQGAVTEATTPTVRKSCAC